MQRNARLEKLALRTKRFAVEIVRLHGTLPKTLECQIVSRQMMRAGTLVGARYRESLQQLTAAEFINNIRLCRQSLEETIYWLELLEESGLTSDYVLLALRNEAARLSAVFAELINKAKPRRNLKAVANTIA